MENIANSIQDQFVLWYERGIVIFPKVLLGLFILLLCMLLSKRIDKWVHRLLDTKSDDPILTNFIASISRIIVILIGMLTFLQIVGLGKLVTSILATAGLSAFIIGFAFKDIGENFLAGMMMAFNRPFKLGDVIKVNNFKGRIVQLRFRDTQIKTEDGIDVYIPNAVMLKNPLQNFTIDGFIRFDFSLRISQQENIEKTTQLILESLKNNKGILLEERKPTVGIKNILGKQFELDIHYWRDTFKTDISNYDARTKVIENVSQKLRAEGIEIL